MGDDLMSNMLEQAIADAAALREQAIKNAEQSVLDKYSKQIKEAVDQMLEMDGATTRAEEMIAEAEDEIMQEEEAAGMGGAAPAGESATIEAPGAYDSRPGSEDVYVKMSAMLDNLPFDENDEIELDFGDLDPEPLDLSQDAEGATDDLGGLDMGTPDDAAGDDLGGDLDLGGDDAGGDDDLDLQLQEVLSMLEEEDEALEEAMHIDQDPELAALGGVWRHNRSREKFNADMAEVLYDEDSEEESEDVNEELMGQVNELHETVDSLTQQNSQLERVLTKLEVHLEESLLSNAKLLYQNRTLADASLNERQKSKIVEAIANAESPKEAKKLHETLKATVGSTPNSKRDPQSLSESVNRRSNLSSMLNSRQNINESKQSADPFLAKMQKLAGIKK